MPDDSLLDPTTETPSLESGIQQPVATPPPAPVEDTAPQTAATAPEQQANAPQPAPTAPAPAPTHTWDEIAGSDDFKALPKPEQVTVLSNYTHEVSNHLRSLPGADSNQVDADLKQFTDTKINDIYPPPGFLKTIGVKLGQGMADTASGVLSWLANDIDKNDLKNPENKGWLNGITKALLGGQTDQADEQAIKKMTGTMRELAGFISEQKGDIAQSNQYGPDWFKWKFGTDAQQAFAKNLPQSEGSTAGNVAASVIGPLLYGSFGLPALIVQHRFQSYGDNFERTNDPEQASRAANLATVGDLLFVGQAHGINAGLERILPEGIGAVTKWATKVAAGTAGNITTGQLLAAADAASNAPDGDAGKAFREKIMDLGVTDAGIQTAFALLGAGTPFERTQRIANAHSELQGDIAKAQAMELAGLPKSAAEQRAAAQTNFEQKVAAYDAHLEESASGLSKVQALQERGLQRAPTDTLQDMLANKNLAKPFRERLEGELARRAQGEEPSIRKQPAEVASTPDIEILGPQHPARGEDEHIVSSAIADETGTKAVVGDNFNTPHAIITNSAIENHGIIPLEPSQYGFIAQDANGKRRFVGRDEAGEIAIKSGQTKESAPHNFQSQYLTEGGEITNGNETRQSNNPNQTRTETSTNAQRQELLTPEATAPRASTPEAAGVRRQAADEPAPVRDIADAHLQSTADALGDGGKATPELTKEVEARYKVANQLLGDRGANSQAREHILDLLRSDLMKNKEETGDPFKTIAKTDTANHKAGDVVPYGATKRLSSKLQDYLDLHENSRRGALPEREKALDYDPEDVAPKTGKLPGEDLDFASPSGRAARPTESGAELSPAERVERAEAAVKEGEHPYAAQVRGAISRHFASFARDPEVPTTAAPGATKDQVTRAAKIVYDQILEKATGKKLEIGDTASAAGKPGPVQKLVADPVFRAAVEDKVAGRIRQDIRATIPKERLQHLSPADHDNAFRLMGVENNETNVAAIEHASEQLKAGVPMHQVLDALPDEIKARAQEVSTKFRTNEGIKGALQAIVETAPNTQEGRMQKALAQALIERSGNSPVVVDPTLINREGATGTFDRKSEEIRMAPVTSENRMRGTLLHEATHPILETKIEAFKQGRTDFLSTGDHQALTSLEALMDRARSDKRFQDDPHSRLFYGLSDLHEFVTEVLSNRDFQEFLHSLPAEQQSGAKAFAKTVFDQVKQLLRTLVLGDKPVGEGSVLAEAFDNTIDLIKSGRLEDQIADRYGKHLEPVREESSSPAEVTKTPEFKNWFKESKVVDEKGEPQVVYHGTPRERVNYISPGKGVEVENASFFTDNENMAHEYTTPREYGEPVYEDHEGNEIKPGVVVPAYLSIENPLRVDFKGEVGDAIRFTKLVKEAKEAGHDGIIATNVADGLAGSDNVGTSYVTFRGEQAKHATENSGEFDPNNILIRKQPAFDAEKVEVQRKQRFMDDFAAEHGFKTAEDMAAIDPNLYNEGVRVHGDVNKGIDMNAPGLRFALADTDTRTDTVKRAERLFEKFDKLGVDKKSEDIVQEVLESAIAPTAADFAKAFEKAGFKPSTAEAAGNVMEAHLQLAAFDKADAQAKVAGEGVQKRATRDQQPISRTASENGENPTSIKNAVVDKEREARGLPPAMQAARKAFGEVWDRAMHIVNAEPGRGADLVEELNTKARPLSDEENAVLLHRQITLQNEYNGAVEAVNSAAKSGDSLKLEENRVKLARLADGLLDVYNAGKAAGTENARGLNIRKMLVNEDYSLANMITRELASRDGHIPEELRAKVDAEVQALHQKLFEAHEKLLDVETRNDEKQSTSTGEAAVEDMVARVGGGEPTAGRNGTGGSRNGKGSGGKPRVVKPRGPKEELTLDAQKQKIMAGIQKALAKKGDLNDVQPWIKKLAENYVRRGLDKLQPLSRALHETVKVIIPDITERQVRDMFSGYGDFKQLDHDAIKTKVRDLKGLLQQAGKIGDMIGGEAPKKTGAERRTPSDHERELIKLVNEVKKEGGFSVTDPAKQLKTALDSVKTRLKNQIKDMTRQIETGVRPEGKKGIEYDAEAETLEALRDRVQETLDAIVENPGLSEEQRVKTATKALNKSIEEYNRRLETDDYSRRDKKAPVSTPAVEALRAQRDALRAEYKTFEALEHPERRQEALLNAYKTRIASRIAELEQRIAENNFAPKPKKPSTVLDNEALSATAAYERVRDEYELRLTKNRLASRSFPEKGQDFLANYGRAVKLTAISTLFKLGAAAAHRVVTNPIEEAIGSVLSKVPGVSKAFAKADVEQGGLNLRIEAKALAEGMTSGMKDFWDTLSKGQSDLVAAFGKKHNTPRSVLDWFGELHAAMKAPTKRVAFTRAFERLAEQALRDGVDLSNPLVKTQLQVKAYQRADRDIFMQDNRVVQAYRQAVAALERADTVTGKPTTGGKLAATGLKVLFPIVKVPANYVSEAFVSSFGVVTGSVRLARAFAKGIDTLHPDEANLIARHLKKGSLGAAVMLLGFFNSAPGVIQGGGYYQGGEKRKEGDLDPSELKVFGHSVPKFLAHTPLIEVFQMGRTIRRVSDSYVSSTEREKRGITAGLWAGALGLAEETPFLDTVFQSKKIQESPADYFGNMARGILVPGAVSNVAQWTDRENGEATKRKAKTFLQQIELGIPVLRQNVPKKQK